MIRNYNNKYTAEPFNYEKVSKSENSLQVGKIQQVNRNNHLFLTYNVRLLDYANTLVNNCQLLSSDLGGYNGVGTVAPLEVGTPVLVGFKDGSMQQAYILGSFYTWGNYDAVSEKGELQEINVDDSYNQPLPHPNRITQTDAYIKTYPFKSNVSEGGFFNDEEVSSLRPTPGIIELRNTQGNLVNYSVGAQIYYSEENIIQVSRGHRKTKVDKLIEFALQHYQRADSVYNNLATLEPITKESGITVLSTNSQIKKSLIAKEDLGLVNNGYLAQQELRLAAAYLEAAGKLNSESYLASSQIESAQEQLDKAFEINNAKNEGTVVKSNYQPTVKTKFVNPLKYGTRQNFGFGKLDIVLHQAAADLQTALTVIGDLTTNQSYHALIDKDGTVIELVNFTQKTFATSDISEELDETAVNIGFIIEENQEITALQYKSLGWLIASNNLTDSKLLQHGLLQPTPKDKLIVDEVKIKRAIAENG